MAFSSVVCGDVVKMLREMEDGQVRCCVTSPPYWGLRDYGADGQLGLEPTPEDYVAKLVQVLHEVRRVLADDGTLWLNLGDSYSRAQETNVPQTKNKPVEFPVHCKVGSSDGAVGRAARPGTRASVVGVLPKNLIGIPWRVALALQADGWYLRSDIIWHKPNTMPESVTDRPTKSHEYLFLLSKRPSYYYDHESVREARESTGPSGNKRRKPAALRGVVYSKSATNPNDGVAGSVQYKDRDGKRNRRSVWTIPTKPFKGAHFAVMPEALVEPCILAGSAEGDTVLDPFAGSGTVGVVALRHGRNSIGFDLNKEYVKMAKARIASSQKEG